MESERMEQRAAPKWDETMVPNTARPVWADQNMTCENCRFRDQDIDTFPCAKCHTRTRH